MGKSKTSKSGNYKSKNSSIQKNKFGQGTTQYLKFKK